MSRVLSPPDPQRFPIGTSIKLYARDVFPAIPDVPSGEPPKGKPAATAKIVNDGTVTFDKLDDGVAYVAYAQVDDEHRYFLIGVAPQS